MTQAAWLNSVPAHQLEAMHSETDKLKIRVIRTEPIVPITLVLSNIYRLLTYFFSGAFLL
ncbi:MAG: hypothetical protein GX639_16425 [Fibrobacter sp.]|nr:hypothetical protein [Fibrobacter sp.]